MSASKSFDEFWKIKNSLKVPYNDPRRTEKLRAFLCFIHGASMGASVLKEKIIRLEKIVAEKDGEIQKFKTYICESCYGIGEIGVPMPDGSYENRECECYTVLKNPFIEKIASRDAMIEKLEETIKQVAKHQHDGKRGCTCDILNRALDSLTEWRKQNE